MNFIGIFFTEDRNDCNVFLIKISTDKLKLVFCDFGEKRVNNIENRFKFLLNNQDRDFKSLKSRELLLKGRDLPYDLLISKQGRIPDIKVPLSVFK